jgi:glutaconyl-CoA decarboxylase
VVNLSSLRSYLKAFAGASYQNPESICPHHQMMLPRLIKG